MASFYPGDQRTGPSNIDPNRPFTDQIFPDDEIAENPNFQGRSNYERSANDFMTN